MVNEKCIINSLGNLQSLTDNSDRNFGKLSPKQRELVQNQGRKLNYIKVVDKICA